ncbi:hypothetical protein QE152_g30336 [Popillia japonica]|uniref:Secreted protein n=1 Tax=Popillia japonica TaxID=7064 RepID=A0AAW1JEZ8_POPJA
MKCSIVKWFCLGMFFVVFGNILCIPIGQPEAAIEIMSQIPQWHCMRYRKFELVRRCRSYKNGLRRNNTRDGEVVEMA